MRAVWRGVVIAESDETVVVEGNHYFPPESVNRRYLVPSAHTTTCSRKGRASYFTLRVGDDVNRDAAWCYADPEPAAAHVRGRIAFWRGVTVTAGDVSDAGDAGGSRTASTGLLARLRSAFGA